MKTFKIILRLYIALISFDIVGVPLYGQQVFLNMYKNEWIHNIDQIYLVNLPTRPDRLAQSHEELSKHNIPYIVFPATQMNDGAYGLILTMYNLFLEAEQKNLGTILIFEDDVTILQDSLIGLMNNVMRQAETTDYDLLYLGANVDSALSVVKNCPQLLQCYSLYTSHAIVYSPQGWRKCLAAFRKSLNKKWSGIAYDQILVKDIQRNGKCYVTNPLIAGQRPGYSDIVKDEVDPRRHIQDKFQKRLRELREV